MFFDKQYKQLVFGHRAAASGGKRSRKSVFRNMMTNMFLTKHVTNLVFGHKWNNILDKFT